MTFTPMKIQGAWIHSPNIFSDNRGSFHEILKLSDLHAELGRGFEVHQVNQSRSHKGVVRGIHWTLGAPGQAKYVSCTKGAIWDVVVDVRADSATFGQWDAEFISSENGKSVLISEGLGHAFLSLEDNSTATYLCSSEFNPVADRILNPMTLELGIPFLEIAQSHGIESLILSEKDRSAPMSLSEIR